MDADWLYVDGSLILGPLDRSDYKDRSKNNQVEQFFKCFPWTAIRNYSVRIVFGPEEFDTEYDLYNRRGM